MKEYRMSVTVEPEKVEMMLRAGMAAPSACNKQPWHFVVINDREKAAELKAAEDVTVWPLSETERLIIENLAQESRG